MGFLFFKRIPYTAWLAILLVCTLSLCFALFPYQLKRGCWIAEWPFEKVCPAGMTSGINPTLPEADYAKHLQSNPGNAFAYKWLALNRWNEKAANSIVSVDAALKLAPHDLQLLALNANYNFTNQNAIEAAASLIKLAELGNPIADMPLLTLLMSKQYQAVVLDLINKNSVWLDRLIKISHPKIPIQNLMPAYNRGKALGILSKETTIYFIDKLQTAGHWSEAYSLWITYQGATKEGLFNTGFDYKVSQKAFDWKWLQVPDAEKSIVIRQISSQPNPGMLIELEFLGRSAISLPMIYQNVMLFGDSYIFTGRYRTDKMQINEGLSWKFSCATGGETWSQTDALLDTDKQWKKFELKFKVPEKCGSAILLGLETKNRGEARIGITGVVQFDDLSIVTTP